MTPEEELTKLITNKKISNVTRVIFLGYPCNWGFQVTGNSSISHCNLWTQHIE
ncbi:MAG: hypothetical protein NT166_06405 [Candidatus Aminicenantes bacterium]|nr:hypothetical protein [Candidatus Aminicenantes bacterium]